MAYSQNLGVDEVCHQTVVSSDCRATYSLPHSFCHHFAEERQC